MTHTAHRKRRARARREATPKWWLDGEDALRRALAAPLHPDDAYWVGRRGWPKTEESARRLVDNAWWAPLGTPAPTGVPKPPLWQPLGRTGRAG